MNEPTNRDTSPEHLLLTMAKTYPAFTGDLAPQGYQYDLFLGAWIMNSSGSLAHRVAQSAADYDKEARH